MTFHSERCKIYIYETIFFCHHIQFQSLLVRRFVMYSTFLCLVQHTCTVFWYEK